MTLLDDLVQGFVGVARTWIDFITNPLGFVVDETTDVDVDQIEEEANQQVDRFFGTFFDGLEDDVVEEVLADEPLTPENVETLINGAEGAAVEDAVAAAAGLYGIEAIGAGQLESGQFLVTQVLSFLALENVLGRRLGMAYEKGVDPALEARIAKQTRSEFVNLQDAVEDALRNKTNDDNWLHASGAPAEVVERVGSNEPVNPENLVEEWGIRDDNLEILEEVGIKTLEPEELFETPTEFGVTIPRDVVEDELDRAGLAEGTKELFLEIVDALPRATTVWEEQTRYEELINLLDDAADSGELDPDAARPLLDGLEPETVDELVERFRVIQEVPNKAPTRSQVDGSFTAGFTDLDTLTDRYGRVDVDPDRYPDVIREVVLSEIDGDLQRAFALGYISAGEYGELMDLVDLPTEAQTTLTAGGDLGDVADRALKEQTGPGEQPVESISGIGENRGSGLRAVGIETVADLAGSTVETVAEAAQVGEETARDFIEAAQLRVT